MNNLFSRSFQFQGIDYKIGDYVYISNERHPDDEDKAYIGQIADLFETGKAQDYCETPELYRFLHNFSSSDVIEYCQIKWKSRPGVEPATSRIWQHRQHSGNNDAKPLSQIPQK
jgi:hypothetical protein